LEILKCTTKVVHLTAFRFSSAWVFYWSNDSPADCAQNCANNCAINVANDSDFRSAVLAALDT